MTRPLHAGRLTQRLTLRRRVAGVDAFGQESVTWADLASVWGEAEPLQGREFFAAAQVREDVTVRFVIRYRSDVTAKDRVVWNGREFDVYAVLEDDGARVRLTLMASAADAEGR